MEFTKDILDDIDAENSMSRVEQALYRTLSALKDKLEEAMLNLDLGLREEFDVNIENVAIFTDKVLSIGSIEKDENLTEDDKIAKIEEIEYSVRQVSFSEIDETPQDIRRKLDSEEHDFSDINFDDDTI